MSKERAQAVIIEEDSVLLGIGKIDGQIRHFFISGKIQEGETPEEAVIRELREEANVDGKIIFNIVDNTYLVDIGNQIPILGYISQEEDDLEFPERTLEDIKYISLDDYESFKDIDIKYFIFLEKKCKALNYYPIWYEKLRNLIEHYKV
ncbi:NUDIX domain protein [Clostridium argentinense CDC 2741]|uniref:NUDIX domain protein n=1 Tax=Clostridium argentinense CDC 2741 TaxID=1418104 RepID=A0A0C1UAY7_9CLOT|nr:NUDIX domain-containing protein [Clostridium argentinense]ARC83889.1 NUDIX hydrolase [Clostridium argentinense]KIE44745.1 NUDIX domain protein [Clostridium argentinense CDC 2741]NFF39798.1 NUDIX hydrolase [Clostridium argentinense]NFP49798.1 NUDIX hydrolase [Clostridium argentinense]NFP72199.1 NUDIX hydrolase [Clostridium argentinense]